MKSFDFWGTNYDYVGDMALEDRQVKIIKLGEASDILAKRVYFILKIVFEK